jgi:pSer/pThr/pTyr-binding forkhead associated (FHA) protein
MSTPDLPQTAADPFVVLREPTGRQVTVELDGSRDAVTIGRRAEADVALPWDREVSRLHAELRRVAGEWTITDDGLSQNGTFVNEVRLVGRRRLGDGDLIRVGRTRLTFRDPAAAAGLLTLLPGELNAASAFSDQQHAVLRELCRPLAQDGDGVVPATDEAIAAGLGIPVDTVASEMEAFYGVFGLQDVEPAEARVTVARMALGSGIVSFEDLT